MWEYENVYEGEEKDRCRKAKSVRMCVRRRGTSVVGSKEDVTCVRKRRKTVSKGGQM